MHERVWSVEQVLQYVTERKGQDDVWQSLGREVGDLPLDNVKVCLQSICHLLDVKAGSFKSSSSSKKRKIDQENVLTEQSSLTTDATISEQSQPLPAEDVALEDAAAFEEKTAAKNGMRADEKSALPSSPPTTQATKTRVSLKKKDCSQSLFTDSEGMEEEDPESHGESADCAFMNDPSQTQESVTNATIPEAGGNKKVTSLRAGYVSAVSRLVELIGMCCKSFTSTVEEVVDEFMDNDWTRQSFSEQCLRIRCGQRVLFGDTVLHSESEIGEMINLFRFVRAKHLQAIYEARAGKSASESDLFSCKLINHFLRQPGDTMECFYKIRSCHRKFCQEQITRMQQILNVSSFVPEADLTPGKKQLLSKAADIRFVMQRILDLETTPGGSALEDLFYRLTHVIPVDHPAVLLVEREVVTVPLSMVTECERFVRSEAKRLISLEKEESEAAARQAAVLAAKAEGELSEKRKKFDLVREIVTFLEETYESANPLFSKGDAAIEPCVFLGILPEITQQDLKIYRRKLTLILHPDKAQLDWMPPEEQNEWRKRITHTFTVALKAIDKKLSNPTIIYRCPSRLFPLLGDWGIQAARTRPSSSESTQESQRKRVANSMPAGSCADTPGRSRKRNTCTEECLRPFEFMLGSKAKSPVKIVVESFALPFVMTSWGYDEGGDGVEISLANCSFSVLDFFIELRILSPCKPPETAQIITPGWAQLTWKSICTVTYHWKRATQLLKLHMKSDMFLLPPNTGLPLIVLIHSDKPTVTRTNGSPALHVRMAQLLVIPPKHASDQVPMPQDRLSKKDLIQLLETIPKKKLPSKYFRTMLTKSQLQLLSSSELKKLAAQVVECLASTPFVADIMS